MSRREVEGVRGKERERERIGKTGESERRGEAWPDVNNKGTSVPAPGPAKLGGGRRAEEANEDKEGGGGPTGKKPGSGSMADSYIPKNRLYIDLGLGLGYTPPHRRPSSLSNWAGVSIE